MAGKYNWLHSRNAKPQSARRPLGVLQGQRDRTADAAAGTGGRGGGVGCVGLEFSW